jgi:hypothetical protein
MTTEGNKTGLETSGHDASRRHLLKLGAIAAPAAMMLKSGHAWAASVFCQISVPLLGRDGNNAWRPIIGAPATLPGTTTTIAPDVAPGSVITVVAIQAPPTNGFYSGSQLSGGGLATLPQAHIAYLSSLQQGQGLSCLVSIGLVP